jgi:hypothetical protein
MGTTVRSRRGPVADGNVAATITRRIRCRPSVALLGRPALVGAIDAALGPFGALDTLRGSETRRENDEGGNKEAKGTHGKNSETGVSATPREARRPAGYRAPLIWFAARFDVALRQMLS